MVGYPPSIIVQLFNDWEIELLILLSLALQLFIFFFGGLRRRNNHMLLQLPLWLAYLAADSVAIYALGYLSRHLPTTTTNNDHAMSNQTQLLKVLWAPFLLVHLGGQDTLTAFSIEDNELWLRHMLNLIVQVSLVLYVLCKSVAAYDRITVLVIFVFITGIINYVERIWALKQGSKKSLKGSSHIEVVQSREVQQEVGTEFTYPTIVKGALDCQQHVKHLFAKQTILQMMQTLQDSIYTFYEEQHEEGNHSQLFFKSQKLGRGGQTPWGSTT
uniref:DUF4220 domain-containing protein n=1 Tax=Aegilops tauschii TaxID=37682 RepID=M8BWP2_AEGTA